MADEADMTGEREEREAPMRIAASRKPVGPVATGSCLFCDAKPLPEGHRWCDAGCREDWELDKRARSQRPT